MVRITGTIRKDQRNLSTHSVPYSQFRVSVWMPQNGQDQRHHTQEGPHKREDLFSLYIVAVPLGALAQETSPSKTRTTTMHSSTIYRAIGMCTSLHLYNYTDLKFYTNEFQVWLYTPVERVAKLHHK